MSEKGNSEKVKREYNKKELVCVIVSVMLLIAVGTYAWFASNGLRYFFGVKPITQAFTLYLTDSKDKRPLEMRTKVPPSINSKQEVVFKVNSRVNESDVANDNVKYELEMNYTENLPVTYELYKYYPDDEAYAKLDNYSTAITEQRRKQAYTDNGYELDYINQFNKGIYRQYSDNLTLQPYFEMGQEPDMYKVVISWDRNRVNNPADLLEYNKETDLIYIVAREITSENQE